MNVEYKDEIFYAKDVRSVFIKSSYTREAHPICFGTVFFFYALVFPMFLSN